MKFLLPDILTAECAGRAMALNLYAPVEIGVSPCLAGAAALVAARLLMKRRIPVSLTLTEEADLGDSPFAVNLRILKKLQAKVSIDTCDAEDYPCVISGTDMTATLGSSNFLVAVNFLKYEHEHKWDHWKIAGNPLLAHIDDARIMSIEEIRELESQCRDIYEYSELCMMEHAGIGAAIVACDMAASGGKNGEIVILAGPGNNGGDAFVVARGLLDRGLPVRLIILTESYSGAAEIQFEIISQQPQFIHKYNAQELERLLQSARLIIDGLFGIGLSREISGEYAEIIQKINQSQVPVLALDVPSGLDADSGEIRGAAVKAHKTVTFAALKPGMVTGLGKELCGEIVIADLGDPVLKTQMF